MTATFTSESYTPEEIHAGDYPIATQAEIAGAAVAALTIVGRVTSSKKVIVSDPAATDGSQTPVGIAAFAAAADGDNISVYSSGGYDITKLTLGDWTEANLKAAFDGTPLFLVTPGAI